MLTLADTPSGAIARLDAAIDRRGETIRLRRGDKSSPAALITLKGFVRGFTADEVVDGSDINQNDDKVIVSPSGLAAWPAPLSGDGDWCEIDGRWRKIVKSRARKLNDVVVRIELQVKG